MMIRYEKKRNKTLVILDNRIVGCIREVNNGFQYVTSFGFASKVFSGIGNAKIALGKVHRYQLNIASKII